MEPFLQGFVNLFISKWLLFETRASLSHPIVAMFFYRLTSQSVLSSVPEAQLRLCLKNLINLTVVCAVLL